MPLNRFATNLNWKILKNRFLCERDIFSKIVLDIFLHVLGAFYILNKLLLEIWIVLHPIRNISLFLINFLSLRKV